MKIKITVSALILAVLVLFSSCTNKVSASFDVKGTEIKCGMEMSKLLDEFKDLKYDYSESISCEYNGLDKVYDFSDSGFVIYTYPENDKDYVLEIAVTSKDITQKDGKLKIGMSKADIEALYGTDYENEGELMVYSLNDGLTLNFLVIDNVLEEYSLSAAQ